MSLAKWITWRAAPGETFEVHGYRVTPQIQTLQVTLPVGGFVWSRPTAILVHKERQAEWIPIMDRTRVAQLFIFLGAIILYLRLRQIYTKDPT